MITIKIKGIAGHNKADMAGASEVAFHLLKGQYKKAATIK